MPLAFLLLMTAACSPEKTTLAAGASQPPAFAGAIETVTPSPIIETYRASGTVRARYTAEIAAKIAANILEIRVQAGDRVTAGQTLLVLDRGNLEANVRRAEAACTEADSEIAGTEHAIAATNANLDLARVTHKRFEDLLANASVSQQEWDESQARLKSAGAAFELAASKRRQAEARRSQAEAELAAARVALGYATLAAPFAGQVTERKADPGSMATPGTPLLIVEREGNLRLETSIDESRIALVRIGEQVAVEIDGLNRTVTGRVVQIVPSIDASTRSFLAKIDLPPLAGLRAGMFGRADFDGTVRDALLVPQSAVLERGQVRSVYVLEREIARLRLVTLGETRDNRREILSGLTAGETVIVAPPPLLSDGTRVAIPGASR
jgi:RND family efflux transporter MFP subunit